MADIFDAEQARFFCAVAIERNQCAGLLNTLANGGAVTIEPDPDSLVPRLVFITADQVTWLATDGQEGHP